jgi:hypothetical protein
MMSKSHGRVRTGGHFSAEAYVATKKQIFSQILHGSFLDPVDWCFKFNSANQLNGLGGVCGNENFG